MFALAYGPKIDVVTYEAYDISGYTFYTEDRDHKDSDYQNSGGDDVGHHR
jgi:hypothetical protein